MRIKNITSKVKDGNVIMECKVSNLLEYIDAITSIDYKDSYKTWERNVLLFRGQSNCEYKLMPSIGKNRYSSVDGTILDHERNLIEMAKYKMPDVFSKDMLPVETLALLQHYGVPTRLLDVTENSLVALYFACCNNECDGEVIVFKNDEYDITNYPVINGIADSYRFAKGTLCFLKDFYDDIINQSYFTEQKHTIEVCHKTEEDCVNWIMECCKNPRIIYAPIRSIRQQAQAGRYILFTNRINNGNGAPYFEKIIDPLKKDSELIVKRIIVSKDCKQDIIEKLKLMGITKASMFCDNVDIVCEDIVERFK